jgi:hypothetical protein
LSSAPTFIDVVPGRKAILPASTLAKNLDEPFDARKAAFPVLIERALEVTNVTLPDRCDDFVVLGNGLVIVRD